MRQITVPPPGPLERARDWAHWSIWDVFGDYSPWSLGVTEDGRVQAIGDQVSDIGTWRVDDNNNLIVEVDRYLAR